MIQKVSENNNSLPMELNLGQHCSVVFKVTKSMVDSFAELTGDKSSLHTNDKFARRSAYRSRVVHGMLPVTFISTLSVCNSESYQSTFRKITATFTKPVFEGDELRLTAKVVEAHQDQSLVEFEYSIEQIKNGAIVTTGFFTISYEPFKTHFRPKWVMDTEDMIEVMPSEEMEESEYALEEVEKGLSHEFNFVITKKCCQALFDILKEGLSNDAHYNFSYWVSKCNAKELLATTLLSTFVGMRIPGKNATFIDFVFKSQEPLNWNNLLTMKGSVSFKSKSTETFILDICITDGNSKEFLMKGKINARVHQPPKPMPSIKELKEQVLDLKLENKVVLVTGGSRGIGETTAKLFSLYGAKVVVNYLSGEEEANRIVKEINDNGAQAMAIRADVSDRLQVDQMINAAVKQFGSVDILVNNAVRDAYPIPFKELSWDDIQKDIDVVIKGAFNCAQAVMPLMIERGGGKIINVSTVFTDNPPKDQAKYVISKSGLVGLSRSLAVEYAKHNIQVNMVVPSIVETDLSKNVPKMFLESMKRETPMNRNATSVDVARSILFLASEQSSFTTGQKIMVTGGKGPYL